MSVIIKEAVAPLLIACNKREEALATTILIVWKSLDKVQLSLEARL